MKKYEYKVLYSHPKDENGRDIGFDDYLNIMGEEGWRLVKTNEPQAQSLTGIAVFERVKENK